MALGRKFALAQTATLLQIGVSVQDVERTLRWLERALPANADPATWLPTEQELNLPADTAAVADARTDWYLSPSVPKRFKRLLDAKAATNA